MCSDVWVEFLNEIGRFLGIGVAKAIPSKELSTMMCVSERDVRKRISYYRNKGVPVLSSVTGKYRGYYLAKDEREIERFKLQIQSRIENLELIIINL